MYGRSPHVDSLLRAARRPRLATPSAVALGSPATAASTPRTLCVLHSETKNPARAGFCLLLNVG